MKRMLKGLLCISILLSSTAIAKDYTFGKTFFNQRSQGHNTARKMAGWISHLHKYDMEEFYGSMYIAPEFTRSFNAQDVGRYLFFNDKNTMHFGPAQNNLGNPTTTDVASINFGLPNDFEADVEAKPRVDNFIFDIGGYIGLDNWVKGLYVKAYLPLTYTRCKWNLEENVRVQGTNIAAGVIDAGAITPTVNDVKTAWKGQVLEGDINSVWEYGKVDDSRDNSKFRPADLELAIGWNWIKEKGFLGFNIVAFAPTGNKVKGEYFFEPKVGNDHWELGLGLMGKARLWTNDTQTLDLYFDGQATHMFEKEQKRAFDLTANGKGSRYLLLKEFNANVYNNRLLNAINKVTLDADVKIDVRGDASLMLCYKRKGMTLEGGYNIWGRSKEDITIKGTITPNKYGIYQVATANAGLANPNVTASNTVISGFGTNDDPNVYLATSQLDKTSAEAPGALSHKIFSHIAYNWWDNEHCPFIGIGGEVEFSGRKNNSFDQWGIWVKGGLNY